MGDTGPMGDAEETLSSLVKVIRRQSIALLNRVSAGGFAEVFKGICTLHVPAFNKSDYHYSYNYLIISRETSKSLQFSSLESTKTQSDEPKSSCEGGQSDGKSKARERYKNDRGFRFGHILYMYVFYNLADSRLQTVIVIRRKISIQ